MNSNNVELLGTYGGDIEHACSAWQSTDRTLTEEKRERIPAMLTKLAMDGHHTPFEKSAFRSPSSSSKSVRTGKRCA
jgi:hypothetical protein